MNEIIVEAVAEKAGTTRGVTKRVLKAFVEVIPELVGQYEKVRVANLGMFYKRVLQPRKSRNPHTRETVEVGHSANMRFKPARRVRRYARENWIPK